MVVGDQRVNVDIEVTTPTNENTASRMHGNAKLGTCQVSKLVTCTDDTQIRRLKSEICILEVVTQAPLSSTVIPINCCNIT
jgi:hypothetical protein